MMTCLQYCGNCFCSSWSCWLASSYFIIHKSLTFSNTSYQNIYIIITGTCFKIYTNSLFQLDGNVRGRLELDLGSFSSFLQGTQVTGSDGMKIDKWTIDLGSILGWKLRLSSSGASVTFAAMLDEETVQIKFKMIWDDLIKILICFVSFGGRRYPSILLRNPR